MRVLSLLGPGLRWSGLRRTGLRRTGLRWSGLRRSGLRRSGLRGSGLRQSGLLCSGGRRSGLRGLGLRRKIWCFQSCLFTPRIPLGDALFQSLDVLLVCHGSPRSQRPSPDTMPEAVVSGSVLLRS
jgi:hypothetical protein